jgi:hypothetical protein
MNGFDFCFWARGINGTKPTEDRLLTQAVVQLEIKKFIKEVLC